MRRNSAYDSQETAIKKHLIAGQSITPQEALERFRCFRLAAVIHRLRVQGMDIKTKIRKGGGKHWAEYRLNDHQGELF